MEITWDTSMFDVGTDVEGEPGKRSSPATPNQDAVSAKLPRLMKMREY
jgi:hypothetical protein